jgi:succinyl-CoA synthetase beta subunit
LAESAEKAVAIAMEIGFPVALKVESPDVQHKTEVGGVRLGCKSSDEVLSQFHEIMTAVRRNAPEASIAGIVVEPMIPQGVELLLAARCDPTVGPIVVVGLGGVQAELLRDTALRLAPVTADDAEEMLSDLRGRALLDGFRGSPPSDVEAVIRAIQSASQLAVQFRETLLTFEINPLIVLSRGEGVVAADVLAEFHSSSGQE